MEYDQLGMSQPAPFTNGQGGFEDHLIQFDVGQDDFVQQTKPQTQKQKRGKNSKSFDNNDAIGFGQTNVITKGDLMKRFDDVEVQYKGFMLKKADPRPDGTSSWARVIQNPLPFSDAELAEESKKVRHETKTDTLTVYNSLSSEQAGVVQRLISRLQSGERAPDARWVLHSVKKHQEVKKTSWMTAIRKTTKIQIILRRQGRTAVKPGQKASSSLQRTYKSGELIDLADSLPKRGTDLDSYQTLNQPQTLGNIKTVKKGKKNSNQNQEQIHMQQLTQQFDQNYQPQDFPNLRQQEQPWVEPFSQNNTFNDGAMMGGGIDPFAQGGNGPAPLPMMQEPCPERNPYQPQQAMVPPLAPLPPPPASQPPFGAILVGEWDRQQGQMHEHDRRQGSYSRPPSLRHDPFQDNPFRPNDNMYDPGTYGLPDNMHDPRTSHSRPRARSSTPGPRYSSRDPSRDRNLHNDIPYEHDQNQDQFERRQSRQDKAQRRSSKQLQRKFDNLDDKLEQVINKVDEWALQRQGDDHHQRLNRSQSSRRHHQDDRYHDTSSDSSSYLADNIWTAPASGASFTPPETPPLEPIYLDGQGSLSRRKTFSSPRQQRRNTSYVSHGDHHDVVHTLINNPSYPSERPRYRTSNNTSARPTLHHSSTWQAGAAPNDYPDYPIAVERERPRRLIQQAYHPDDVAYMDHGGRSKYDGNRSGSRRDSGYAVRGDGYDGGGGTGERVVFVESRGRREGRRSSSYIH